MVFITRGLLLPFFPGSSAHKYEITKRLEAGMNSSYYHSITAMEPYKNSSNEEIRIEDYNASGGLFGSKFSKLGAALCMPQPKLKPYDYGQLLKEAFVATIKHEDKKSAIPDVPLDNFKMKKEVQQQNISLCFHGKQNVQVIIKSVGEQNLNLSFQQNSSVKNVGHESKPSKVKSCDEKNEPIFPNSE